MFHMEFCRKHQLGKIVGFIITRKTKSFISVNNNLCFLNPPSPSPLLGATPGPTPHLPLHHSPRAALWHVDFFENSHLVLMNSQGAESVSQFWALYFSILSQYLMQMKLLNLFKDPLHTGEEAGRFSKYGRG